MCAAKLLKRNKNNNVAVALVTTERSAKAKKPQSHSTAQMELIKAEAFEDNKAAGQTPPLLNVKSPTA